LPEDQWPPALINLIDQPGYRATFKAIKERIAQISLQTGLSVELLASRKQINQLLSWYWRLTPPHRIPQLLSSWREKLVGTALREILEGDDKLAVITSA